MHFYDAKTAEPRYEVPYADPSKGMRSATLADAKKHGWVPSVTTVLGILAKPALENWKVEQAILAALTNPNISDDMTHDEMMRVIKRDSQQQAKQAAERGTAIHNSIEARLLLRKGLAEYFTFARGAIDCVARSVGVHTDYLHHWNVEARLPGGLGYGGKCDLHSDEWLIDFKTKEFSQEDVDAGKIKGWPEQHVQLVAYDHGFGGKRRRLANVFVSVTEPGLCHFYEWPEDEYDIGLRRWQATLEAWLAWKDPKGELMAWRDAA